MGSWPDCGPEVLCFSLTKREVVLIARWEVEKMTAVAWGGGWGGGD